MVHLLQVALALFAWIAAELGLESGFEAPALVPLLALGPYWLRLVGRRAAMRGRFRRAARFERLLTLVAPLLFLVALSALGWRATVARWTGSEPSLLEWPGPETLLGLAPFVLYALAAIDARARLAAVPDALRGSLRALDVRGFLGALSPFALYLVAAGLVGRVRPLAVRVEEVSAWGAAFAGGCIGLFVLLLPFGLRLGAATEPLPAGPTRELFDAVARRARFRCRAVLVWRTGGLVANAAVVGLGARLRMVLVSDALLAQLAPRELAAVFAHEFGHARRHHVLVFLSWSIGFLWLADAAARQVDPSGGASGAAVVGVALLIWFFGFGWISRRFELDADLFGLELLGDASGLAAALGRLDGGLHGRGGWRHFSPARRAAFLERAAEVPGFARGFRRRLRALAAAGALVFAAGAALELAALAEAWPVEQALADQRLGRGEQARARAAGLAADGRDLAQLAARAADEARAALAGGDVAAGRSWLALGGSAGDPGLADAARALALLGGGDPERARAALGLDPEAWWPLLSAAASGGVAQ